MKIKMTQTVQGSLDGVTVQELIDGQEYDTANSPRGAKLAKYHIAQGVAVAAPVPSSPVDTPAAADAYSEARQ